MFQLHMYLKHLFLMAQGLSLVCPLESFALYKILVLFPIALVCASGSTPLCSAFASRSTLVIVVCFVHEALQSTRHTHTHTRLAAHIYTCTYLYMHMHMLLGAFRTHVFVPICLLMEFTMKGVREWMCIFHA